MYQIKEAVIVEGVYDKIKLSRFLDGIIIVTNGFHIFSAPHELENIKKFAATCGVVILTDPDAAGFKIRNYIKQALPPHQVLHAYIPDTPGKERRKRVPGKEGLLGVEGVSEEIILKALRDSGCTISGDAVKPRRARSVTKADLASDGLAGGMNSATLRRELAAALGLPGRLSANMLLDAINRLLDADEYRNIVETLKNNSKTTDKY